MLNKIRTTLVSEAHPVISATVWVAVFFTFALLTGVAFGVSSWLVGIVGLVAVAVSFFMIDDSIKAWENLQEDEYRNDSTP